MKNKTYSIIISLLFLAIIFQACSNTSNPVNPPDPSGMINYGSQFLVGGMAKVELFAADSFRVGYNKIYMKLTDSASGNIINDAHISAIPYITSGGTTVSSAYQKPAGENPTHDNMFEASVIIPNQGVGSDKWYVRVHIHNHSVTPAVSGDAFYYDLKIHNNDGKFSTTVGPDGLTYYWAYVEPKNPAIGLNNFEFYAYKKMSNLSFPAVDSLSVVVKPWMMSMGHSSPNNVNPVFQSGGLYKGSVNFTMSGDWRLYINTTNTLGQKDSTYFDIVF